MPHDYRTNHERAHAAAHAVLSRRRLTEPMAEPFDLSTTEDEHVSDLLADIFHLCDRDGHDLVHLLAQARANYLNERHPESHLIPILA
jgi:hypothetical protein